MKKLQAVRAGAGADITSSHEPEGNMVEAKYEAGASTYGKASIRNKRRFGTKGENPDPLTGKKITKDATRGELITKRREEHKAKRGMKNEEIEVDEAMAMKPSNIKKKAKLSAALKRLEDLKVASKMKEEVEDTEEGMQYGIFKGDGKPKGAMAAFGKKEKAKKDKKIKMEALSDWKEDYVWEADEEQMEKEVKEKKVKNKIIINPKLGEAVEELGGQLLDVQEMSHGDKEEDPQMKSKMLRQRQLKKQVLLRKLQAVRQTGGEDIVASYEPEGEQVDEVVGGLANAIRIGGALGLGLSLPKLMQAAKKAGQNLRNLNLKKTTPQTQTNEYEPEGEQLDEYGNPRVGMRLRAARAIDRVNPKPKVGSKRTAMSNALKMSAIKAETKRREQKENPYSAGKKVRMALGMSNEDYIPEEGYDIARDMGKVPPTKDKKDATTMPPSKEMEKTRKVNKDPSALDIVKADIRKKYGKGAIMGEAKSEQLDEDPIRNLINKFRTSFMNKTRNNPNFKIPIGNKGSIDSEAMRIKKYDAATGGEFSKMLGR